jgi:hypothetical protein
MATMGGTLYGLFDFWLYGVLAKRRPAVPAERTIPEQAPS